MSKRKGKDKPLTMLKAYPLLNQDDRLICCHAVQVLGNGSPDMHMGLLPFVRISTVQTALLYTLGRRKAAINEKLNQVKHLYATRKRAGYLKTEGLWLDNAKVARLFGSRPERGHPMRLLGIKKVTVGVRWSLPHKDYVPDDDVLVVPAIALKNIYQNFWQVLVADEYRIVAEQWLLDHVS